MNATTTTTSCGGSVGDELRAARKRAGLTRAQLAILSGCSLASLGNFEAGVIPRQSLALARVRDVLAEAERAANDESDRQADPPDGRATADGAGRHAAR